jgi:hypothetical protein
MKKNLHEWLSNILFCCILIVFSAVFSGCNSGNMLTPADFKFDGPLGSQGTTIEKIQGNTFRVKLGNAPEQPEWPNKLNVEITGNAKGKDLVLVVEGPRRYPMNEYFTSWSYDMINWHPVQWKSGSKKSPERDTLVFPVFEKEKVYIGHQVPLSYEQAEAYIDSIKVNSNVKVTTPGKSLEGRNLYRITITDPSGSVAAKDKWVHYFTNPHPGEHNAQWRIIGMINWLLSDKGADMRKRSICHFVIIMSADGPHNGWYRVNGQGIDMNRSYFPDGADESKQAHESYIFQKDLEELMKSESPVTTIWGNHTATGAVIPMLYPGKEIGTKTGDWTEWRDILKGMAPPSLMQEMVLRPEPAYGGVSWEYGPHVQFGITGVLCESGGALYTKAENLKSGELLIESLSMFYKGTKN